MNFKLISRKYYMLLLVISFISCNPNNPSPGKLSTTDIVEKKQIAGVVDTLIKINTDQVSNNQPKVKLSTVLIYNFHVTNRCPSCIAIENATTKTLDTYFANEVKKGRIKRYILNVDDKANNSISSKYEAFGSSMFVTRVLDGKESTTDLTGDGFKYAKNKEEKFIEILKTTITNYLN